jgi:hypothetical protein
MLHFPPLHLADAVHDLLLQSARGFIDIFPAIPDAWSEAEFHGLCAEGGFRVSARFADGSVDWILITSAKGGKCSIRCKMEAPATVSINCDEITAKKIKDFYEIDLQAGDTLEIRSSQFTVGDIPREVAGNEAFFNYFGSSKPWRDLHDLSFFKI